MARRTLNSPSVLIRKCLAPATQPKHYSSESVLPPSKARSANSSRFSAPGRWMPSHARSNILTHHAAFGMRKSGRVRFAAGPNLFLYFLTMVRFCVSLCSGFLHAVVARDVKNKREGVFLQFSLR